jgi:ABC-type phosphate transport system permease subunit
MPRADAEANPKAVRDGGLLMDGKAYKDGLAFAAVVLVSAAVLIWLTIDAFLSASDTGAIAVARGASEAVSDTSDGDGIFPSIDVAMLWSLALLIVAAIGSAVAIVVGWRADRRDAAALRITVARLEAQIQSLGGMAEPD